MFAAVATGLAAAAGAQQQRAPYQPPTRQRIVQGVADATGYVVDGKWVPSFIYKPELPDVTDPNAFDRPGKWQGESRPGYRCNPTPQSVAFYRYIMEKAGRGEPINTAEAMTIRRMIVNRTWPEAPTVTDADRAARGWADRQPEGASVLNPAAWSRGFISDIVYGNLAEAGKLDEDKPHSAQSDAFRKYWHSLTPEERKNLPLARWLYNRMVRLGFDMRSDAQREEEGKYEAERRRREQEAAAREEAERQKEEARAQYERQQEWFRNKWAEEDRRAEAEAARERLAEAIRKSREEYGGTGAAPGAASIPGPAGGDAAGHGRGGRVGGHDGLDGSTARDGSPDDGGGRVAEGTPDSSGQDPVDPAMAGGGEASSQGDESPRKDAGEKVDAGRYQNGDRVVTSEGKEYENRGGTWVATGSNYGRYSPDGLRGAEPPTGESEDGGAAKTGGAGLSGFTGSRAERTESHTEASIGLAGGRQEMDRAATAGDAASRDARAAIDAAGQDAQSIVAGSAAKTAAENRAGSLGEAIGEGLQQGIERGLAAAGESFGKAAADKAAGAIFKDGSSDSGKSGGRSGGAAPPSSGGVPGPGGQTAVTGGGSHGGHSHGGGSRGSSKNASGKREKAAGTGEHGGSSGGGDGESVMVTCPACGRSVPGRKGEGVQCPYCVTMTCPRCGYSKVYPRGEEPDSCPMCYTVTCNLCGHTSYARRDRPAPQCPNCIRIRCSTCGSVLYAGPKSSAPASPVCASCAAKAAGSGPQSEN